MSCLLLPHVRQSVAIVCLLAAQSLPVYLMAQEATLAKTKIEGAELTIKDHSLQIHLGADFTGNGIEIPRLAAPLTSLRWQGETATNSIKLQPELQSWKLSWDKRPEGVNVIEMQLGAAAVVMDEVLPVEAVGDGSLFLPAHLAFTSGSKIRYEPQTFKNTVGYWAGMDNSAYWKISVTAPGKFNVAILQGCGAGQGGSTAEVSFLGPVSGEATDTASAAKLEFEVQETGHFQNFIWRHLGVAEVKEAGEYRLQIAPKNIKRGALMDVRAVHLIRLP